LHGVIFAKIVAAGWTTVHIGFEGSIQTILVEDKIIIGSEKCAV